MTPGIRVIDRIAQVLASTGALGTFATRRTASVNELRLDVVGVGPIPLPLYPANARRLCCIAAPARYGLRDQTLLDRNVRDAGEIGKRQVNRKAQKPLAEGTKAFCRPYPWPFRDPSRTVQPIENLTRPPFGRGSPQWMRPNS